jgi:dephospho-CoA kinase
VSVSNASPDSDLAYFAGKGRVEGILRESGLSRAIVRPTLVVGPPDILVSNIAWLLRRFPLFLLPGGGRYRLQPILLSETGRILAEAAESSAALEIDAAGPEILTFRDLVRLVARSIGKRRWIVGAPAWLSMAALKCVEPFVRDRILVREEYLGLSRDLLVSRALPLSSIPVGEWLLAHGDDLGRTWTNDLRRHFGEGRGDPVLAPAGAVRPPVGQHGRMLVLGITGRNCAGKDSVADLLERRGFERRSLSDCLREELRSLGRPVTREALIEMGRELRAAEGPAVLAERTKRALATDRAVVVSVRSPAEVASLRRLPRFVLLAVDAPRHLRYEREVARRREGGVGSFEEFRALEAREDSTDPNAQQLGAAIALADHTITNDGSREDLERRVLALLEELDG